MEVSLIDQGISLMLFGMGTVFVFLTVLVFATNLMSLVVNKLNPPVAETNTSPAPNSPPVIANQPSSRVISIIEKTIEKHRATK